MADEIKVEQEKTAEEKQPKPKAKPRQAVKVHTWPHLVRLEFLVIIFAMALLTVWSITVDAPLEETANPTKTPNPSKAPWYFLGLQEMLVYFDPWIAGVVLPSLIILGLMAIPYLDINPKGNGYFAFKERPFAIVVYLYGFLILWVFLIIIGTFFRGPGWNLFWPWEKWDVHKVVAITNVDLPYLVGIRSYNWAMLFGALVVGGYYFLPVPIYWILRRTKSQMIEQLGAIRYGITVFLLLTMVALPIKIFLRLLLNVKYIWVTPWFNI